MRRRSPTSALLFLCENAKSHRVPLRLWRLTHMHSARDVIYKLLAFTMAMISVPIGGYFLTVNTIFKGPASHPAKSRTLAIASVATDTLQATHHLPVALLLS